MNLQLGPLSHRVREILDQHRAELPPMENQDDEDRIWRLAMHRMDLRQYTPREDAVEAPVAGDESTPPKDGQHYVRLDPKTPEPDVKEMMDQSAAQFQAMNARLGLLMWGRKVFGREEVVTYDPGQWRREWLPHANRWPVPDRAPPNGRGGRCAFRKE